MRRMKPSDVFRQAAEIMHEEAQTRYVYMSCCRAIELAAGKNKYYSGHYFDETEIHKTFRDMFCPRIEKVNHYWFGRSTPTPEQFTHRINALLLAAEACKGFYND